uniref:Macro domain-containing protein n=1 Tax=Amphiprion ocellaris TaxID=80972 RepID=A0AAQ6A9U3_AMPOC
SDLRTGTMESKLDIPLHGYSVNIVKHCGPGLSEIFSSKFGCVATFEGVEFERDWSIASPTVAPEKRCAVSLPMGVQASVWKADLTKFPVEAVVNAANSHLQHWGGLAQALSEAGGPTIQRECADYVKKYGDLKTGEAIVSDAGLLQCKKIIHAVGPDLPRHPSKPDVSQAKPLLEKAIKSILDKVKENQLTTVAIPAISSGLFHYPLPECFHMGCTLSSNQKMLILIYVKFCMSILRHCMTMENSTLELLFDLKKQQLGCSTSQTMFQCIPAQFCEMVSHVGFHAECAPPEAYGDGIYFTGTVRTAMKTWKERNEEYLYFVEAEVLTGDSTAGKPGLILPPAKGKDPHILYDSVTGGSDVAVIFSGYQALPRYIITCKRV